MSHNLPIPILLSMWAVGSPGWLTELPTYWTVLTEPHRICHIDKKGLSQGRLPYTF